MKHTLCSAELETQAEFQIQVTLMFVQDTKTKLNFNEHFQLDSAIAVSIQQRSTHRSTAEILA